MKYRLCYDYDAEMIEQLIRRKAVKDVYRLTDQEVRKVLGEYFYRCKKRST